MVHLITVFFSKLFLYFLLFIGSIIQILHQDISGVSSFKRETNNPQIVVLCYHHVGLPFYSPYSISTGALNRQLNALAEEGFVYVSLKELEDFYHQHKPLPKKSAVVTFDDGNHSVYANAYPLLKRKQIPFAVFVYPNVIDHNYQRSAMTWGELRRMQQDGVIVGSHSYTHPILTFPKRRDHINTPEQYDQWLERETLGSKMRLEEKLGVSVNYFVAPYGALDKYSRKQIKSAGYKLIFNVNPMNNDRYADPYNLNRVLVRNYQSTNRLLEFCEIRPINFLFTAPVNLQRLADREMMVKFRVKDPLHYQKDSFRLNISNLKFDEPLYYNEYTRCYEKSVVLPKDGFYYLTVSALDLMGNEHRSALLILKNKKFPNYYPDQK